MSVMVLNWNGQRYLQSCLDSVTRDACKHVEVVLVDNGSTDGSVDLVRSQFPSVQVVAHATNLGFSTSYNLAVRQARGRYLVFLNNDTAVEVGWLVALIDHLIRNPAVGITMSKQLFMGTNVIVTVGGQLKLWQGTSELGYGQDEGSFDAREATEPFFASGAAMAISRELFDKLGGFDESIQLYCEDLDLSWRARMLGYKIRCVTGSVVYHHISGTSGPHSPAKLRLVVNHYLEVMLKCLSVPHLLHSLPAYACFTMALGCGLSILEFDLAYFKSVLLAFADAVDAREDVRRRRRHTQTRRLVADGSVLRSEGFGLVDSPWVLFRNLRRGRRLSKSRMPVMANARLPSDITPTHRP